MQSILKTGFVVIALATGFCFGLISEAHAGNGNTPGANPGNNDNKSSSDKSTKSNPTVNLSEKEWVVIEVSDNSATNKKEDQVSVEKKNISQVAVTWVEIKSCQKNTTPEILVPILKEISQSSNHRKVYITEDNGKKYYYISPVTSPVQEKATNNSESNTITLPVLWQVKI